MDGFAALVPLKERAVQKQNVFHKFRNFVEDMANLGQIFTKQNVADYMVGMFTLDDGAEVLDPCVGGGAFVNSLLKHSTYQISGVEIDSTLLDDLPFHNESRCRLHKGDFFDVTTKYDGVIMNPPYIRQEEIDNLTAAFGISKQKVQEVCAMTPISTKANMYMYFILHGIQLLRPDGELIAIFPNSWENTPLGKQFKEQIIRHTQIQEFITVCGNPFEGNPIVDVCIIKLKKGRIGETVYKTLYVNDNNIYAEPVQSTPNCTIHNPNLIKLKSIASIRRGITTGANKLFMSPHLDDHSHIIDIIASPKSIAGYTTLDVTHERMLAIGPYDTISDEEQAYLRKCESIICAEGKPITLKKKIEQNECWYRLNIPRPAQLLFAYIIRSNMKFIYNATASHARDNFYMLTPHSINAYLLMALLNNYHVYLQLERKGKTYGNGLLKIQTYDLADLQIPNPQRMAQGKIAQLSTLGKMLVGTSNTTLLDKISSILDDIYTQDSKTEYLTLRRNRLGA